MRKRKSARVKEEEECKNEGEEIFKNERGRKNARMKEEECKKEEGRVQE